MTPTDLETLTHPRSGDAIGDIDAVSAYAVARVLAPALNADGYRQLYDYYADGTKVYRFTTSAPERVTYRAFADEVRERVYTLLDDALGAPGLTPVASRRLKGTREAITTAARGSRVWLRSVVNITRDSIEDLTDEETETVEALAREASAARVSAIAPADYAKARAARRAAAQGEIDADLRAVLEVWLGGLPDGDHALTEVWAAFEDARARSANVRETRPGALSAGRNTFYRVAGELADIRTRGARSRFLSVPYLLRVRSLLTRRKYAQALLFQRAEHARRATS
jgi:hypothetical protein